MDQTPIIILPTVWGRQQKVQNLTDKLYKMSGCEFNLFMYVNDGVRGTVACMMQLIDTLPEDRFILQLNDDNEPRTEGFLKKLQDKYLEVFELGDGIVNPDDNHQKGTRANIPFTRVRYLKKFFYRGYWNHALDFELKAIAGNRQEWYYYPEVMIAHVHHGFGECEADDLNRRGMETWDKDNQLYYDRFKASNGFKDLSKIELNRI